MATRLPESFSPFSLRELMWRDFRGAYNDVRRVLDEVSRFKNAVIKVINGVLVLRNYTVATLPDAASSQWGLIVVTDEVGGAVPAFSDGTNWRRVTDRAVVS